MIVVTATAIAMGTVIVEIVIVTVQRTVIIAT